MKRILIPMAAGLALIANAGIGAVQGQERPGREGPAPGGGRPGGMPAPGAGGGNRDVNVPRAAQPERQGPRIEGPRGGVEQQRRAEPQQQRRSEPPQPNRERQGTNQGEQRRAAEQERQRTTDRARNAEREQRRAAEQERSRVTERQRNAERERNAERTRAVERERTQELRRAEERQRKSAEPAGRPDRQATDRNQRGDRVATERREEMRQARTRLSADEHRRLHDAFDLRRTRVTNARFDWHVGHRVPRHVHLYPVPREVISFFPYYRDYRYFAVDEEICIVDPRTYEVVDVIDHGYRGGPRPEVAGLSLSRTEIAFVRDSIPPDFPETPMRLRLALGAEISGDIELYEFPVVVLDRLPQLGNYRFLVAADQIVIVDPRDRSIALVIDRT